MYVYKTSVCVYITACVCVCGWEVEAVCSENSKKEDTERKLNTGGSLKYRAG